MQILREAGLLTAADAISAMAFYLKSRRDRYRLQGYPPLSEYEAKVLREAGGVGGEPVDESLDAANRVKLACEFANLITHSQTQEGVAALLSVSRSRIRQRIAEGSLYVFDGPNGQMLPNFQFTSEGTALPGLRTVLNAITPGTHPLAVSRFFQTPTADLFTETSLTPMSPAEWLKAGLPLESVVLLAEAL
jgi:hypothetical protein